MFISDNTLLLSLFFYSPLTLPSVGEVMKEEEGLVGVQSGIWRTVSAVCTSTTSRRNMAQNGQKCHIRHDKYALKSTDAFRKK